MTENVNMESQERLYGLCKSGSINDLEQFFAGYPDINTIEPWSHNSALILASEYGRLKIIEYLIDKGADVNKLGHYGISALIKAAQNGNADIVRLLIENGAKLDIKEREQGLTALTSAIRANSTEIAKILLHSGAKVNHPAGELGDSPLAIAVVKDNIELADLLIKDGADVNLVSADRAPLVGARSYEMTQLLLSHGADPYFKDENGGTIINGFMHLDTTGPLKALLDQGVSIEQTSRDGETPLMRAAMFGGVSFIRLLLDHGADVNATNDQGETAFLKAADSGYVDILNVLHDTGEVSIDYKDHYVGYSALYRASSEGHIEAVKYLLEKGANTESRTIGGDTALHAACNKGSKDVVGSLLKAGADIFVRNGNLYTTSRCRA